MAATAADLSARAARERCAEWSRVSVERRRIHSHRSRVIRVVPPVRGCEETADAVEYERAARNATHPRSAAAPGAESARSPIGRLEISVCATPCRGGTTTRPSTPRRSVIPGHGCRVHQQRAAEWWWCQRHSSLPVPRMRRQERFQPAEAARSNKGVRHAMRERVGAMLGHGSRPGPVCPPVTGKSVERTRATQGQGQWPRPFETNGVRCRQRDQQQSLASLVSADSWPRPVHGAGAAIPVRHDLRAEARESDSTRSATRAGPESSAMHARC